MSPDWGDLAVAADGDSERRDLEAADTVRLEVLIEEAGEPLPISLIARRFFAAEEARETVEYSPGHAYLIGQRVAWDTPSYGRLIGEVAGVEHVLGRWQMLIHWDERLSPGFAKYRERRAGIRVAYVFDPSAAPPSPPETDSRVSISQLLDLDLADDLRCNGAFVEWARCFAPRRLLPSLDVASLQRAAIKATQDDGLAQTNQVLDLMGLPASDRLGHGFAAMAVNLLMDQDPAWTWSGPRDGGEWMPAESLAAAAAALGPVPTAERGLAEELVPDVADDLLPEDLADLVIEATLRGITPDDWDGVLMHIVSDWERRTACLVLDSVEAGLLPQQATLHLAVEGSEVVPALMLPDHVLQPPLGAVADLIRSAAVVRLRRLGHTDVFVLELVAPCDADLFDVEPLGLLEAIIDAFGSGEPRTAVAVLGALRARFPGDLTLMARIVAAILAGYECFEADAEGWRYLPARPHRPSIDLGSIQVRVMRQRSDRVRTYVLAQDREFRRFRAESLRSPHMVRGHLRRLVKRKTANPFQVALASRYGINVPRGYTFVRPHERHGGGWAAWAGR